MVKSAEDTEVKFRDGEGQVISLRIDVDEFIGVLNGLKFTCNNADYRIGSRSWQPARLVTVNSRGFSVNSKRKMYAAYALNYTARLKWFGNEDDGFIDKTYPEITCAKKDDATRTLKVNDISVRFKSDIDYHSATYMIKSIYGTLD
jgi:hypothetical protein